VLEIGCGFAAKNLFAIEDQAKSLVGVDFNVSEVAKTHPKFTAIESDAVSAIEGLTDNSFDLILLVSVLEHLDDPADILRRCHGLLKAGGVLLINVPTWRGKGFLEFSAFRLGFSPKEEMDDHKMYYDKRDLWPLLVRGGFLPSNVRLRYHKFSLNLFAICQRAAS
jgi:2-polyprenyl-3-methyl-5-hydroxy-6-metoxy-1,4-benzoquinol methylase